MAAMAEGMKVSDPVRVSRTGLRNGGESKELQFRSGLYGWKMLQGKNVLDDSLWFLFAFGAFFGAFWGWVWGSKWP